MTKKDDDFLTPSTKKIRFRGDLNSYYFENHIEDILEDPDRRKVKNDSDEKGKRTPIQNAIKFQYILFPLHRTRSR